MEVPGVLVGVCDRCDNIITIPAQSTPRIRDVRVPAKDEQLEARIPTHLEDVIYLLASEFAVSVQAFRPAVLRYYLAELMRDPALAKRVRVLVWAGLRRRRSTARDNHRLSRRNYRV